MTKPEKKTLSLTHTIEEKGPNLSNLTIQIDSSHMQQLYQEANQSVKADPSLHLDTLIEEKVESLILQSYAQVIEEVGLNVISHPKIDVLQLGMSSPLQFLAQVQLMPEVILADYKSIQVKVPPTPPEMEEIDWIQHTVIETVVSQAQVEVPEALTQQELRSFWLETEGEKMKQLPEKIQEISLKNWLNDPTFQTQARERAKSVLVLSAIARKENLSVSEEDMEWCVNQLAVDNQCTPEDILQQYEREALADKLLTLKIANWLMEKVTIEQG